GPPEAPTRGARPRRSGAPPWDGRGARIEHRPARRRGSPQANRLPPPAPGGSLASRPRSRAPAPGAGRRTSGREESDIVAGAGGRAAAHALPSRPLVEGHPPLTVRVLAPDGVEPAGRLPGRVPDRSRTQRQRARSEHLHYVGPPREGRGRSFEERRPGARDRVTLAKRLVAVEEDRLGRDEAEERLEVSIRQRLRERDLAGFDLGRGRRALALEAVRLREEHDPDPHRRCPPRTASRTASSSTHPPPPDKPVPGSTNRSCAPKDRAGGAGASMGCRVGGSPLRNARPDSGRSTAWPSAAAQSIGAVRTVPPVTMPPRSPS